MKITKKQNTALGSLFVASLFIPMAGIVHAAETEIEQSVSDSISTTTEAKEKFNTLVGKDDGSATQAQTEESIDTAKEKLNDLKGKSEDSVAEAQAGIKQQTEIEAKNEEPGFFDKMKSKVHDMTASDSDGEAKDEQFVSE